MAEIFEYLHRDLPGCDENAAKGKPYALYSAFHSIAHTLFNSIAVEPMDSYEVPRISEWIFRSGQTRCKKKAFVHPSSPQTM